MHTQFRSAITPAEIRSLVIFDHKVFQYPAYRFDREDWQIYESWWMIIDSRKIGCCGFKRHVDFQDDLREDGENPRLRGSLYICDDGHFAKLQGLGLWKPPKVLAGLVRASSWLCADHHKYAEGQQIDDRSEQKVRF